MFAGIWPRVRASALALISHGSTWISSFNVFELVLVDVAVTQSGIQDSTRDLVVDTVARGA